VQFSEFHKRSGLVWFAVLLALLFWVGDSVLDGIFFENTGYFSELVPDDPKELWMRLLLVTVMLGFGIVVQLLVNRRSQDQARLRLAATVFESAADAILVDVNGRKVMDLPGVNGSGADSAVRHHDVRHLAPGVYAVVGRDGRHRGKVVKVR